MGKRSEAWEKVAVWGEGLSISPRSALRYAVRLDGGGKGRRKVASMWGLKDNQHKGQVSKVAGRNIERCVQWLVLAAKWQKVYSYACQKFVRFKVNMITLTLPSKQIHSDQQIKAVLLNQFLIELKKYDGLKEYIWRAEAQQNGNIHFHVITSTFISHERVRKVWNRVLDKLGYIQRYEQEKGKTNPPTTEIKSIKHVKKVASYLAKYIAKDRRRVAVGEVRLINGQLIEILYKSAEYRSEEAEKKQGKIVATMISELIRPIEGRLWYASKGLQGGGTVSIDQTCPTYEDTLTAIKNGCERYAAHEYGTSYYGDIGNIVMWAGGEAGEKLKILQDKARG